jgi:hypothetical protein
MNPDQRKFKLTTQATFYESTIRRSPFALYIPFNLARSYLHILFATFSISALSTMSVIEMPWLEIIIGRTRCLPIHPNTQMMGWHSGAATLYAAIPSGKTIDIRLDQEVYHIAVCLCFTAYIYSIDRLLVSGSKRFRSFCGCQF